MDDYEKEISVKAKHHYCSLQTISHATQIKHEGGGTSFVRYSKAGLFVWISRRSMPSRYSFYAISCGKCIERFSILGKV